MNEVVSVGSGIAGFVDEGLDMLGDVICVGCGMTALYVRLSDVPHIT